MEFIKKLGQAVWDVIQSIFQGIRKVIAWWLNKVKNSGSKKGAAAWLAGGLITICILGSFLFSLTPSGRESIANSNATSTAEAIAEATSEKATQNAPTRTPEPSKTPRPTAVPEDTATAQPAIEPSPTALPPTTIPTETAVPTEPALEALVSIVGSQVNIRSGPGTAYPVLLTLAQGDSAPALGFNEEQSWVQIELADGDQGWVGTDLVDITNTENIKTVTDIPALPAAADSEQQQAVQEPSTSPAENTEQPTVQEPAAPADTSASRGNTINPFQCNGGCAEPPDPSCAIKGNVNSKGDWIYHVPRSRSYNITTINFEEGDRWFCTIAEAVAAGFRAPNQ